MSLPEGAITNEAGQVAMKWNLPRPAQTLKIDGTDRYYVFTYAHNVAMIWADPQDVGRLMSIEMKRCNCNGGTYNKAVVLANQIDVNLHRCGNRTCD